MISALRNTLAGLAVAAVCIPAAHAQVNGKNQGYLVDQDFRVACHPAPCGGMGETIAPDWRPTES